MENQIQPDIQSNVPSTEPVFQTPVRLSNRKNYSIFVLIGLIVVAGLLFLAFQMGKSQYATKQAPANQSNNVPTPIISNPTTLPVESNPTTDPTAGWKTYKNTKDINKYEFSHPGNWYLKECKPNADEYTTILLSPQSMPECETEPFYPIVISATRTKDSYEAIKARYAKVGFEASVQSDSSILLTNLHTDPFSTNMGDELLQRFWDDNAHNLHVTVMVNDIKHKETSSQILSTFSFLDQPTPNPTADWKTYESAKYGFSFKYPNLWGPPKIEGESIFLFDLFNIHTRIDKGKWYDNLPLDPYSSAFKVKVGDIVGNNPQNTKIADLTINGSPAVLFSMDNLNTTQEEPGFAYVYAIHRELSIYEFNFYSTNKENIVNSKPVFDQILSTFKFL